MQAIKNVICSSFMNLCRVFPINNKKVVVSSYFGGRYACNPRIISEALEGRGLDVVWVLPKEISELYKGRCVQRGSFRYLYELATAKIWIDNCRKAVWTRKRKNQYYIQTWHGGISLKKVEKEVVDALPPFYVANAKHDSEMADLFLSPCKWCTDKYRESFWYDGEIMEGGLPRSDIFFRNLQEYYEKVCKHYNVQQGVRFALYAPTFRVDQSTDCYCIDYKRLKDTLEKNWGGEWKILVRLHPNVQKNQNFMTYDENVLNGSAYEEINELIMASDLLITDYSSCSFDAMLAKKRVLLFASDIEEYNKDRGTYFQLNELPFPLSESNDELMSAVEKFDETVYQVDVEAFKQRMQMYEDGYATERVVERILQVINGSYNKEKG